MKWLYKVFLLHKKAFLHSLSLRRQQNNLGQIKSNDIILFSVMKNESHRLSFFIDYYRKLGVNHFILVDNGSTDNFSEIVAGSSDITSYYTTASYKEANFGMYWVNYLLLRFGRGHWCMTCDPDEFLVYPHNETRDLRDLTNYLSSMKEDSFFTTMIDMYSDKVVEESYYPEGENPLDTCSYFDGTGYTSSFSAEYNNRFVQGGVRRRVFYSDNPSMSPALNKVPLVKWKWSYAYISSMHMAIPKRLNRAFDAYKTTGALLHYKFISQLAEKVKEEGQAQQHWDNSSEYQKYGDAIAEKTMLYDKSVSCRYENWQSLAKVGLLNKGEW